MTAIPKRLMAYDGVEAAKRKDQAEALEQKSRDYHARQSRFSREFGKILTGEQSTALEKLARAFEIREIIRKRHKLI